MKFKLNKKAQETFTILQSIPRIIFLVVVLFSVVLLVRKFTLDTLNVQEVQSEVFTNRLLYSPNGILYLHPDTKQTVFAVIDPNKITNENIDRLMNYTEEFFIAGQISLFDENNNLVALATHNNRTFNRWLPIARGTSSGSGGVKELNRTTYVQYVEDNKIKTGTLFVTVLQPGK